MNSILEQLLAIYWHMREIKIARQGESSIRAWEGETMCLTSLATVILKCF